ncbi:MATE family efflux transporter [Flammeovirgaceae bacterium SG7u.111]|nr:MATE family efflux transporter [Flammeovirgaceae bacterium SG7u.132]WPO33146.1 MATE family efflux transporter [Flammeovirgaceae bacterium SG7u.111]
MSFLSTYKPHYQRNLAIAIPIILSQAGQMLTGIVDNIMVGRVGTTSLAAASLANSVFFNIIIFGIGFTFGLTPLIGTASARKEVRKVGELLSQSLLINMLLGVLIFIVLFFGSPLIHLMSQPENVVELAIPYFNIIGLSFIPMMFFLTFKQFTEGLSITKPAMVATITSNIINIILNYILIYGKMGFEPMGLNGAGWATLISRVTMGVLLALWVFQSKKCKIYTQFYKWLLLKKETALNLVKMGMPIGFQFTLEVAAFSIGTIMLGWIGEVQLAAHQIALSMASLTYMMANGLASATTVRVSNLYGENNFKEVRNAGVASLHLVVVYMAFCGLLFYLFNKELPVMFVEDPEVLTVAANLLIFAAFFQIFDGVQVVAIGSLRGLSDVTSPTYIAFFSYWVCSLPSGYLLAFHFGLNEYGVWMGFCIGLAIASVLLVMRFFKTHKKMSLQYGQSLAKPIEA